MKVPTYDEICQLPSTRGGVIGPELIDENGHVSIFQYFQLCARGVDDVLQLIGVTDEYREVRQMGTFAAEHHMRYAAELREGDGWSVHPQVLARSAKAFHVLCLMVSTTQRELACTMETVYVHVDLQTRRPVAIPDDIVDPLASLQHAHGSLNLGVPLYGFEGRGQ